MKGLLGAGLGLVLVFAPGVTTRAGEADARAVVDKALQAVGGAEKLSKIKATSTKIKATIFAGDTEIMLSASTLIEGLNRSRSDFEGDANGNRFEGRTVIDGDKGWRKIADNVMPLEGDALANEKRNLYLAEVPVLLLPLKGEGFKLDSAPDEKVDDQMAAVVKVTGPDGKGMTLYFDKTSGLPIKLKARVVGFANDEAEQETFYEAYQEMGGIKRPSRTRITRDGQKFIESEVVEFKPIDPPSADTFAEPK